MCNAAAEILDDTFWEEIEDGTSTLNILEAAMDSAGLNRTPDKLF